MAVSDVNKCVLVGRLARDPEMISTQSGTSIAKFSLAVNHSYKKGDSYASEASFIPIVAWGKLADICGKYLIKGKQTCVVGRLKQEQWKDADGNKKSKLTIVADEVQFFGSAGGGKQESTMTQTEDVYTPPGEPVDEAKLLQDTFGGESQELPF